MGTKIRYTELDRSLEECERFCTSFRTILNVIDGNLLWKMNDDGSYSVGTSLDMDECFRNLDRREIMKSKMLLDKSRLASVCAPRVASWCPHFAFVKIERLPLGSHLQVQSLRVKKGGGLLHHSPSRSEHSPRNEDTKGTPTTNTLSEGFSDTLTHAWVGGKKRQNCSASKSHQHQC